MNFGLYGLGSNGFVLILVFGTFIWALIAQAKVKSAYERYARVLSHRGYTGAEVARRILDANGLRQVRIEEANGFLSDHYDPKAAVVRLSPGVYRGNSIASVAIAAHEVGHAIQHAENYGFIAVRNMLLPAAIAGQHVVFILFFVGMFLGSFVGGFMMDIAILLYFAVVLFQAVTLPVEFDASKRAKMQLVDMGFIDDQELNGVRSMLSAAAMTYVAALATAIAQLIRLLLIRGSSRD